MWSRALLGTGLAAALLLGGAPAAAQTGLPNVGVCSPGLGIGLAEVPTGNRDPRASSYIVDRVAAGTTFSRQVQVCNGTGRDVTVALYAGAATVQDGPFTAVEGRVDNELSRWTTVSPGSVRVPSGERVLARVTIAVPEGVEDGERYAAVLAELPATTGANGVRTASRVGVRIYLDVGQGSGLPSDFVVESLQASRTPQGRPVVTAQVRNTGSRALDMRGELRLGDGPGGLSAGPFPATVGTTLGVGDTAPVQVVLSEVIDGGPWLATITMRSGLLERRAEARITFPDEPGERAPVVAAEELPLAEDPAVLVPVAAFLIGLLLLALLYLLLRAYRRRRPQEQPG